MLQRIQTIFLALGAVCSGLLYAFPFARTSTAEQQSLFDDSLYNLLDHVGLIVLFGVSLILALAAIFLFNNRKRQILVSRLSLLFNILGIFLALILFMNDSKTLKATPDDGLGIYLPILFILFLVLAIRYISKDEKLVKSMDRLR